MASELAVRLELKWDVQSAVALDCPECMSVTKTDSTKVNNLVEQWGLGWDYQQRK